MADSYPTYGSFKQKLRAAVSASGQDASGVDDEMLVSQYADSLSPDEKETFNNRYGLDRGIDKGTGKQYAQLNKEDAAKEAKDIGEAAMKGPLYTDPKYKHDPSFTGFLRAGSAPLTDVFSRTGKTIDDTLGLGKLPGVPQIRQAMSLPMAREIASMTPIAPMLSALDQEGGGRIVDSQTAPFNIAGNAATAGQFSKFGPAMQPLLRGVNAVAGGAQAGLGASDAYNAPDFAGRMRGVMEMAQGIPQFAGAMIPDRVPSTGPELPPPIPNPNAGGRLVPRAEPPQMPPSGPLAEGLRMWGSEPQMPEAVPGPNRLGAVSAEEMGTGRLRLMSPNMPELPPPAPGMQPPLDPMYVAGGAKIPEARFPLPKAQPTKVGTRKLRLGSDKGEATTGLIMNLAGGAVGGAIGGMAGDTPSEKLYGALLGIAGGVGATHAFRLALSPTASVARDALLSAAAPTEHERMSGFRDVWRAENDPIQKNRLMSAYLGGLPDDPATRLRGKAQMETPHGFMGAWRFANTIQKANLLLSPKAIVRQMLNYPNILLRAGIMDPMRAVVSKISGDKLYTGLAFFNPQGSNMKEISPYYSALIASHTNSLRDAYSVFRHGYSEETAALSKGSTPFATGPGHTSLDAPHPEIHNMDLHPAIAAAGWAPDMIFRTINALDVLARGPARASAEAMASVTQALAQGEARGLKGKALNQYVAKNYETAVLTPSQTQEASRRALETVLQEDPGAMTQLLMKAKTNVPAIDGLLPFMKSLGNQARQQIELIPGIGALVHYRYNTQGGKIPHTELMKNEMYAKQATGLVLMAGIAGAEHTGLVEFTGAEPQEIGARIKQKQYRQPYHIIFKDTTGKEKFSVSYAQIPALAGLVATYLGAKDAATKYGESKDTFDAVFAAQHQISGFATNQTQLQPIKDVIDMITGYTEEPSESSAKKKFENTLARMIQSYVVPGVGAQRALFEQVQDNTVRRQPSPDEGGFPHVFNEQLPWNYKNREPVLGWDGKPITRAGNAFTRPLDILNTFVPPGGTTEKIRRYAGDAAVPGAIDTQPTLTIGEGDAKQKVTLSKKQEYQRRQQIGGRTDEKIRALFDSDEFREADKVGRTKLIRAARTAANKEVNAEWKEKLQNR